MPPAHVVGAARRAPRRRPVTAPSRRRRRSRSPRALDRYHGDSPGDRRRHGCLVGGKLPSRLREALQARCAPPAVGRQARHLLLRQRAAEVRHRPPRRQEPRCRCLRGDEQTLPLAEPSDRTVQLRNVGAARRGAQALEHARLVVLCLQPADEPCPRVGHRPVVQVDGVLRRGQTEPRRAACLKIVRIGFFAGERPTEGRSRTPRPCTRARGGRACPPGRASGDEPREDERDDELALFLREMGEVDDAQRGYVVGEQQALGIEWLALAPRGEGGEATSALSVSELRAICGGKNWSTSKTPSLRIGGAWISPIRVPRSRSRPARPRVFGQVRERVLRLASRSAAIPTSARRLVTVPSISSRIVSGSVSQESEARAASR